MRIPLTLVFLAISSVSFADNWPHWRGTTGNGAAFNADPPIQWSDTENVKWKVKVPGKGSASPVIWDDRVFVTTAVPADPNANASDARDLGSQGFDRQRNQRPQPGQRQRGRGDRFGGGRQRGFGGGGGGSQPKLHFEVLCFDRNSGSLLWQQRAITATPHEGTHRTNGFASASPCTDGEHVYASFGSRGLYCYTMDGDLKWSRSDFPPMTTRAGFGEGSSPTIASDKILLPWDHEGQSALYALDKMTGKTIWETKRDEPTEWSTPLVVDTASGQQVVINGQNYARGYDLDSGEELWRSAGQTERPVASAVWIDDLAIVGSGHRGSFMGAFRLDGRGDLTRSESVAWSIERDTPDIASPTLSGGRVYFHKGKDGTISCVDARTGKVLFGPSRVPGISSTYASPVAAGGYVYLTGRRGTTVVIREGDRFEIVGTNSLGEGVDATPAPVDDELFIRGEEHLFCIR
ncbi:MAG: PQQ-binding-like beta-propeller repeat protein [Planctomycetota bacterium]